MDDAPAYFSDSGPRDRACRHDELPHPIAVFDSQAGSAPVGVALPAAPIRHSQPEPLASWRLIIGMTVLPSLFILDRRRFIPAPTS